MTGHRMECRSGKYQASEAEALLLPRNWDPAAQATNPAGVIVTHGRGVGFSQMVTPGYAERIAIALADAGIPVLCIDAGGTVTWGNDASLTAVGNAITRLQSAAVGAGLSGTHLMGYSMGGLVVLNYARAHSAQIKTISLIAPVVDLVYSHDTQGAYSAEQQTAFGLGAGSFAGVGIITSHDPMQNTGAHASGPPVRMWRASDDTVATTARQDAFMTALGSNGVTTDLGAVGHGPAPMAVTPAQVVSFVQAHP